jgi:hypothetical protein
LSVWSQIPEERMLFRPEPRARTALEHMVHQSVSEDVWMRTMLGVDISQSALPPTSQGLPPLISHETRSPWLVDCLLLARSARLGPLYGSLPIAATGTEFSFGAV